MVIKLNFFFHNGYSKRVMDCLMVLLGQDFQGFLNDLQDWELSLKDKDKKMKPQAPQKEKSVTILISHSSEFLICFSA